MNTTAVIANLFFSVISCLAILFVLYQGLSLARYFISQDKEKKKPTLAIFTFGVIGLCVGSFVVLVIGGYIFGYLKMKYAIWAAVSTALQAEDDKESLHEQEAKARKAATAKGWEEAAVYVVPGESRTRYVNLRDAEESIPALRAMLEDAKAGRFDIVVMWDYNRLRDLLDPVAKTLANYGVQLYSVNQPTEPMEPADFNPYASDSESMMRGMSQIISRWQISDLRRKYRFGVKARVDRGLPALKIPYGYMKPPGMEGEPKVIPMHHPVHSLVVIDIKDNFLRHLSIRQIVDYLTSRYPTPTGIPEWSRQTIRKTMTRA